MKILITLFIIFFSSNIFASTEVVNKVFPATVLITAEDKNGQPQSLGSGFLVAPNIIATNFHVIENSYSGYVKFINKKEIYEIEGVVGYNENYDLALIKISNNNANPLPLISPSVDIGQKIFAIGNPLGLEGTISDGIISGLREFQDFSVLQISAPISPGNSGGPVVNENGDVVGVATFTMTEGQNINFAVPVKYLKELLENKISQVSLSSLVNIQTVSSNKPSKDFGGLSFTKFKIHDYGRLLKFSIKNNLRKQIGNIYTIWIVYDDDGEPLDYHHRTFNEAKNICKWGIKPKLANRTQTRPPSEGIFYLKEEDLINHPYLIKDYFKFVEFRILDYDICEE
jgi:hypothetical protein